MIQFEMNQNEVQKIDNVISEALSSGKKIWDWQNLIKSE